MVRSDSRSHIAAIIEREDTICDARLRVPDGFKYIQGQLVTIGCKSPIVWERPRNETGAED